jgi:hypothetical protein
MAFQEDEDFEGRRALATALREAGLSGPRGPVDDYGETGAFESTNPDYLDAPQGADGGAETAFGRVVRLVCTGGASASLGVIQTPDQRRECAWTVTLQITSGPLAPAGVLGAYTPGTVKATLTWMVGGAAFSKVILLRTSLALQFPLLARRVLIDLQVVSTSNATPYVEVAVGAARGGLLTSVERYVPAWHYAENLGNVLVPVTGPGVLLAAVGVVGSTPGAGPYFPMFFDLAPPTSEADMVAALAQPFLVASPITGPGQLFSLSDEFVADLFFEKSLYFGFSTNAGHYVSPGAVFSYSLNVKVGT